MSIDISAIWDQAWAESLAEQEQATQVPVSEWRSAGRKTKDKPHGEDLEFWKQAGLEQTVAYVEWLERSGWKIATLGDQPAIEFEVRAEFGGVEVLGFADCMYETPDLVLVDYKTGSRTPKSWFQLCLYAQAIERMYGVRPVLGAYFMTRKGELSTPEPLDRYDDNFFDRMFHQLDQARQNGPFLPNLGDICHTCDVAYACYARGGAEAYRHDPDHPQFGGHK